MTLLEARKILGLGPDDDPRPFLNEFKEARERIAEMVRTAPNDTLALRYQQGLTDFDKALAAVREHLEAVGLIPKSAPPAPEPVQTTPSADQIVPATEQTIPTPDQIVPAAEQTTPGPVSLVPEPEKVVPAANPTTPDSTEAGTIATEPISRHASPATTAVEKKPGEPAFVFRKADSLPASAPPLPGAAAKTQPIENTPAPTAKIDSASPSRRSLKVIWLLTLVLAGIAGGLFYLADQRDKRDRAKLEVAGLEILGDRFIKNRNWPEAKDVFDRIEKLDPKSDLIALGRRSIEAGMEEEQSQFVGYWTGQAKASMEAKRWDEATAAAKQVLERFPKEKETTDLLEQISAAQAAEADKLAISNARELLQQRKWEEAISAAAKVLSTRPDDEDAKSLLNDANMAKEKAAADLAKAKSLLQQAQAADKGQFDPQVIEWVRQASSLAPEDAEIKAYMEKVAAYARTLRVPGDFATPAEALAKAHDRDRIVIAAGTWEGPLFVNAAVDLQGSGAETTLIQCPAQTGNVITLGPQAKGARISGFTFKHLSFDAGEERFSAALVRGVNAEFTGCRFSDASGHGLAVIEGGHAIVSRCRFSDNGWDGIAASGPGSLLEVRDSESLRNFGHGIESWNGAAIIVIGNRCEENSRNGIHADNGGGSVTFEKNQLVGNREFGLVLSSAGSGKATGNTARGNLLGGYAIRSKAASVGFSGNEALKNDGPGIVLDTGLLPASYSGNSSSGNAGQQVLPNADLTVREEPAPEAPADPTMPPRAQPVPEDR